MSVAALAGRQHGRVTTSQLNARGVTARAIAARCARGEYIRVHRNVYALGHTAGGWNADAMAAVLAVGDRAALSHESAARLDALISLPSQTFHVSTPRHSQSRPGITVHRTRTLARSDVTTIDNIPVTTTARTIFDLAGTSISDDDLAHALANAEYRDRSTRTKLKRIVGRLQGHRGSARIKTLLSDDGPAPTRSWLERRMRSLLTGAGLPLPESNRTVAGRKRDFVWRAQKVVVEVDGWQAHGSRSAFEADRVRDAELTALGWKVLRFSYTRLTTEPMWVIARIAATLVA